MPTPPTQFDPVALQITGALVVVQLGLGVWWYRRTHKPLKQQIEGLRRSTGAVRAARTPDAIKPGSFPSEVARAFRAAFPAGAREEALEPRSAFEPERLLPASYNARLDAAAPGMFTAIGIIGTFLGLIIAFGQLNFSDAARSIQPLIGGMTISFWNSLVGVALSVSWTLASRFVRHDFDAAAHSLLATVEKQFPRPAHDTRVLRMLGALERNERALRRQMRVAIRSAAREGQAIQAAQRTLSEQLVGELGQLRAATQGASRELLESLTPRLEQSFRALVDLPFERLGESVERFRAVVDGTADRSRQTLEALDSSVTSLSAAQDGLRDAALAARTSAQAFELGVHALQDGANAAIAVVAESRRAAEALHETTTTLEQAGERQAQLAQSLDGAIVELRGTAGALDGAAARFTAGAERMEAAAGHIQSLGAEAAESSLQAVRSELEKTVAAMAATLREFGDRSVAAYDSSSARIVEALDARVTDLTDRLSAELQTLATRLPESAAEITRAAGVLRQRLDAAVRGLEQALRSLDAGTTQTLAARLAEYDRLVAQAVDRFSGTLLTWDGKVAELGMGARELRSGMGEMQREVSATLADARGSAEAAAHAAQEASRAASALETAATRLTEAQVRALIAAVVPAEVTLQLDETAVRTTSESLS